MKKRKSNFNISNILTVLRIVLVPFVFWGVYNNNLIFSLVVLTIAFISDFFDGFIARHFNIQTEFGRILDPLADKFIFVAIVFAYIFRESYEIWLVFYIPVIILFSLGYIFFVRKSVVKDNLGKSLYILQIFSLAFVVLDFYSRISFYVFSVLIIFSFFYYLLKFIKSRNGRVNRIRRENKRVKESKRGKRK